MKTIKGDLIKLALAGEFDVIVHGCNCFCSMGGGIAWTIANKFPEALQADCTTTKGDKSKLGTITTATINSENGNFVIVNAYTQYTGGFQKQFDYDALRSAFKLIKKEFHGKRIGYPAIGAGIAGGDWQKIHAIIKEELVGEDHTFVLFKPN